MDEITGLRERKKAATRLALHESALRLAAEQGPDGVTIEAIADAANVSRRTFSNYFSSKEEALFYGDAVRLRRLLQLVRERPGSEPPWTALSRAAEHVARESSDDRDHSWLTRRRQLRGHPGLAAHQVAAYTAIERELAAELAHQLTGPAVELRSRLLTATFLAALRVAFQHWIDHPGHDLLEIVRTALTEVAPPSAAAPAADSTT
ncbi:TetR/AcrR family transcriptional regulator [Micromonospora sp. NBC_00617]|uniref:TetR/AcrR family transcriptional regulator n=1 Tax=Micromonospora sp. NBC_00617 TaxID=2903587 RepID=UPI0030E5C60A